MLEEVAEVGLLPEWPGWPTQAGVGGLASPLSLGAHQQKFMLFRMQSEQAVDQTTTRNKVTFFSPVQKQGLSCSPNQEDVECKEVGMKWNIPGRLLPYWA
jgi:hypothetical protein